MIDEKTRQFLEVVNCDPSQVRDIGEPPSPAELQARRENALGNCELYFGKYKGQRIADVPEGYLRWLIAQPKISKGIEKAKRQIREFLAVAK